MDYKIVIDPGHGGDDPGAIGNGINEKDLNFKISEYMYNRFRELGIPVKMIRSADETTDPATRTKKAIDLFGNGKEIIIISNHINAGGGEGAEVIYALRNTNVLADLVLDSIGKEGQILRKTYQRRLPSDTSKDYYFMHRDTGITEPIIVEYGFLDTKADADRLKANYIKYSEAVVRAVLDYIGYGNKNVYIVKKGDSLWNIANKYKITVEELKAMNDLKSNLLNIGQKLKIPSNEQPEVGNYSAYTVVSGDSLYKIANKFGTTTKELIEYNDLDSTNLKIGQKLLIPKKINAPANGTQNNKYDTYIVSKGDNLYNIASKYGTTASELMSLNNLSSNLLSIGQKILIPKVKNESIYLVKSGDSLYSIARKYNTTAENIKLKNNLSTNNLSIGQILKI